MKLRIFLGLTALALIASGICALAKGTDKDHLALAEFRVQNLSCGSCVKTIGETLGKVAGIGKVDVSVTSGRAKVEYAPGRTDPAAIADKIARAGFPAELAFSLAPEEYRATQEDEERMGTRFVARVGDRLVLRSLFEKRLQGLEKAQSGRTVKETTLYLKVWEQTLQRELLLLAAEEQAVVIQNAEVDREIQRMRKDDEGFDAAVKARFGGIELFKAQIKEDLIIRRNLEDHVLAGEASPMQRQAKLNAWYGELRGTTPVVIFDPTLRATVEGVEGGGGGCGGSCCG